MLGLFVCSMTYHLLMGYAKIWFIFNFFDYNYNYIFNVPRQSLLKFKLFSFHSPVCWSFKIGQLFHCREIKSPNTTSVLDVTLNCIWWWGSSHGTLGNVVNPFIAIMPRSTQTQSGSTCLVPSISQRV